MCVGNWKKLLRSLSLFKSNCCDLFLCVDDIIRCLYILWAGVGLEKSEPYQSIARACTFQSVLRPSTKGYGEPTTDFAKCDDDDDEKTIYFESNEP